MSNPQSMVFKIALEDFDLELLPTDRRQVGSAAFEQGVQNYYTEEFAPLGGSVDVDIEDGEIQVTWNPKTEVRSLIDRAMQELERGRLADAVLYLQVHVSVEPKDATALYNLGMALSDLGRLKEAQLHLLKAVHLEPDNTNALVALGVALFRDGNPSSAQRRLEQALSLEPENGYAHRNLGGLLGNQRDGPGAIRHLREAYRLLPNDPQATYGLAQALESFGSAEDLAEADDLYQEVIQSSPQSQFGELARQARTKIAATTLRSAAGGTPRMDAVMYCLGALEKFSTMTQEEVQGIAFEIALKGRSGLDVNNPDSCYTLRTLPGEFTGLHLMALMYVAFQQIAPDYDIGFDLSKEYQTALELQGLRGQKAD